MKSIPRLTLVVVLLVAAFGVVPVSAETHAPQPPILGTHVVQYGESLYCIGRAYQVSPWAIAQTNSVLWPYTIYPSTTLQIPDVRWYNIPAGPVCVAQFTPPPAATPTPTVVPAPTLTPAPSACRAYYVVRWGDTLFRIARSYGTTIYAIQAANPIIWNVNLIYAGTTLCIP
jgi:LysM repeat protein